MEPALHGFIFPVIGRHEYSKSRAAPEWIDCGFRRSLWRFEVPIISRFVDRFLHLILFLERSGLGSLQGTSHFSLGLKIL